MALQATQITTPRTTIRALLTPREREILHFIAHEYSTREISQKLFISYETALTHRKNLLRKLKVKNVAGLVRVAFEQGILD